MILNKQPPFWFIIREAFPSASLEKQVFAFYPNIYSSVTLSDDILVHEYAHLKQQKSFLGACYWWIWYILDPQYRVQMEIEAYKEQYKYVKERYDRNLVSKLLDKIATNLSSEVYNLCISYEDARNAICRA
jgi:hypothetical protein